MSGFQVSMKLEVKELTGELKALKKRARKALRTGVTKAGRRLRASVRAHMPTETKLLRKSIGSTVRTYPSGAVVAVVGVQKGFRQNVTLKKVYRIVGGRVVLIRNPQAVQRQMIRNPEKYLHLVELGFTQAGGKHVPGKAPIRRGHAAAEAEMQAIIAEEFRAGVEGGQ